MQSGFARFLTLPDRDRRDVFDAASERLDTPPSFVEKDFWVCLVLDALFGNRSTGHPQLVFKGGTSLSKAHRLIPRFSEDIDLVIDREGLGFAGGRDPAGPEVMTNRERRLLFGQLERECSRHVTGALRHIIRQALPSVARVVPDPEDSTGQTLLTEYPTLYATGFDSYVTPRVKVECGARSAVQPRTLVQVAPYIADELGQDWSLLNEVRNHTLMAFRQAWKRFEEAVPGRLHLVPQPEVRVAVERDYRAMGGMIIGTPPSFEWVIEQLTAAEFAVNTPGSK